MTKGVTGAEPVPCRVEFPTKPEQLAERIAKTLLSERITSQCAEGNSGKILDIDTVHSPCAKGREFLVVDRTLLL